MSSRDKRIIILDGFAGPGRYTDGEEGSPIVALRALLDHHYMPQRLRGGLEVRFHFVEQNKDRVKVLRKTVKRFRSAYSWPPSIHVKIVRSRFRRYLAKVLDSLESEGLKLAPTFAVIDPFGF